MNQEQFQIILADRIKMARKQAKLSQLSLARRVRISRTQITNIEAGRINVPIWTLARIAVACGIHLHHLLNPDYKLNPKSMVRMVEWK